MFLQILSEGWSMEKAERSLPEQSPQASTLGSVSFQGHGKVSSEWITLMGIGCWKRSCPPPMEQVSARPLCKVTWKLCLHFYFLNMAGCRETHPDSSLPPGRRFSLLPPRCRRDTRQLVLHLFFF